MALRRVEHTVADVLRLHMGFRVERNLLDGCTHRLGEPRHRLLGSVFEHDGQVYIAKTGVKLPQRSAPEKDNKLDFRYFTSVCFDRCLKEPNKLGSAHDPWKHHSRPRRWRQLRHRTAVTCG